MGNFHMEILQTFPQMTWMRSLFNSKAHPQAPAPKAATLPFAQWRARAAGRQTTNDKEQKNEAVKGPRSRLLIEPQLPSKFLFQGELGLIGLLPPEKERERERERERDACVVTLSFSHAHIDFSIFSLFMYVL